MIMKRQGTSSVSDFLELVTGQTRSHRGNFYGFTLLHPDGRRACYVGHEMESGRPEKYIYGLFPPHEGGGPPSHGSDWNVPGRLKPLWRQGFRVNTETVIYTLSGLPKCFETGITFAIEEILGIDKAIGGVLALDTSLPGVADCVALQRLHDAVPPRCLACGLPGHHANQKLNGSKVCKVEEISDERLPLHIQRMARRAHIEPARSSCEDKVASKESAKIPTAGSSVSCTAPAVTTELSSSVLEAPVRKRSPDVDFQSLWSSVRKKRRLGRSRELGSLADMIEKMIQLMPTAKAKAAKKHINDRIGPWSRRYKYSSPQDYEEEIEEFNSKTGGGMGGVGVSQEFGLAIFKELSSA